MGQFIVKNLYDFAAINTHGMLGEREPDLALLLMSI